LEEEEDDEDEESSHWSSPSSSSSLAYVQSATSLALPTKADEEYVQAKVEERMRAKRTRNYELSDAIRDELMDDWDVTIHDKINEWSAGGDFGSEHSWRNAARPIQYRRQEGDTVLSLGETDTVQSMINERAEARRERNLKLADKLKEQLRITYGIIVNDEAREWYFNKGINKGVVSTATVTPIAKTSKITPTSSSSIMPPLLLREDLLALTVVQLKEKLRQSGQKVSGRKEELIDRLLE